MSERWVPTLGYELARIDGAVHVLRRGSIFVRERIPDDEVMLRSIAVAEDYDEGVRIVRALRSALGPSGDQESTTAP